MTPSEDTKIDLEIEARPTQPASVLLIGAPHVASTGLRTVVRESGSLRLIAEVMPGPGAISAAKKCQPDHILAAADGVTDEIIALLQQVRRTSPGSTLVVCTDRFDPDMLLAAGQIPVEAILAWGDVTSTVLHQTLTLVTRGIHVSSARAAVEVLAAGRSSEALKAKVGLTQHEESILRALGQAKTQRHAAGQLGMAERTLQQRVAAIKDKLRADQPFLLGAWAHALGLVTLRDPSN